MGVLSIESLYYLVSHGRIFFSKYYLRLIFYIFYTFYTFLSFIACIKSPKGQGIRKL